MSYNFQLKHYKEKLEKRQGRAISMNEAAFLYFRRDQIIVASCCSVIATVIVILMIVFACVGFHAETPVGYLLSGVFAACLYSSIPSCMKKVQKYRNRLEKPSVKGTLTRQLLAENPDGLNSSKANRRFVYGNVIALILLLTIAFIYRAHQIAILPLVIALFPVIFLLSELGFRRSRVRIVNKVLAGDCKIYCAKLMDHYMEGDADSANIFFGVFGDDLPLGEGYNSDPRAGCYQLSNVREEEIVVGTNYYIVLVRTKRAEKKGEQIYQLHQMFSTDFYEPDAQVREMIQTAQSAR